MHMTFSDDDFGGSYIGLGSHTVKVKKIEKGQSASGNDKLVVTFVDEAKRERKEHFALTPKAKWKIANLCEACGYSQEQLKSGGITIPSDLIGRELILTVEEAGTEMYNGEEKKRYSSTFTKLDGQPEGMGNPNIDEDSIPF